MNIDLAFDDVEAPKPPGTAEAHIRVVPGPDTAPIEAVVQIAKPLIELPTGAVKERPGAVELPRVKLELTTGVMVYGSGVSVRLVQELPIDLYDPLARAKAADTAMAFVDYFLQRHAAQLQRYLHNVQAANPNTVLVPEHWPVPTKK